MTILASLTLGDAGCEMTYFLPIKFQFVEKQRLKSNIQTFRPCNFFYETPQKICQLIQIISKGGMYKKYRNEFRFR